MQFPDHPGVEARDIQLEILLEIDRICRKHHIPYVLFAGTLLGAVRHHGFIPWDDDIDIAMLREDYNRFLEIAGTELDDRYFLQTQETDPEYFNRQCKIRRNNTLFIQSNYQHFDIHQGIYVDIFPFDNAFPGAFLSLIHRLALGTTRLISRAINYASKPDFITSHPSRLKRLGYRILRPVSSRGNRRRIGVLHEQLLRALNNRSSEFATHLTSSTNRSTYYGNLIQKKYFHDTVPVKFGDHHFPAPKNYHEWLTCMFGEYMTPPPIEKRIPHHNLIKVSTTIAVSRSQRRP